jgi:methylated-DNA-[protein]-cysteine S-methyltransferase
VGGVAQILSRGVIETPLGPLAAVVEDRGLVALRFCVAGAEAEAFIELGAQLHASLVDDGHPLIARVGRQVDAYFDGKRHGFTLPLALRGTPFQLKAWSALQRIGYGETTSYHGVAEMIGQPTANRAVAQACGSNPVPIVVPCHRVIATGGGLGGFSSGLDRKIELLQLEQRVSPQLPLLQLVQRQEAQRKREDAHEHVLDILPAHLRDWLDTVDPMDRALPPNLWLNEAMGAMVPQEWPALAETLAELGKRKGGDDLLYLARDLTSLIAARWAGELPKPEDLKLVLRAAITTNAPSFATIVRQLITSGPLPPAILEVLERHLENLMSGELSSSKATRQTAVDLWLDLHSQGGEDAWVAHRSDNPAPLLAGAGMPLEAAATAEMRLARGEGDRRSTLLVLVDIYEQLGDIQRAHERLLAALVDQDDPTLHERLRRLEDRL